MTKLTNVNADLYGRIQQALTDETEIHVSWDDNSLVSRLRPSGSTKSFEIEICPMGMHRGIPCKVRSYGQKQGKKKTMLTVITPLVDELALVA